MRYFSIPLFITFSSREILVHIQNVIPYIIHNFHWFPMLKVSDLQMVKRSLLGNFALRSLIAIFFLSRVILYEEYYGINLARSIYAEIILGFYDT
jgi:hypothetical protein